MQRDFTGLYNWASEKKINITGEPFSQYHKWDVIKQKVHYTAAIPVEKGITNLPSGIVKGEIPQLKLHTLRHHGSYEHLGNAWSTLMMQKRAKDFKPKKGIPPMEFYKNDPEITEPEDLITDVCFAVK